MHEPLSNKGLKSRTQSMLQCNIVIGKEKYIYILQVHRDILLHVCIKLLFCRLKIQPLHGITYQINIDNHAGTKHTGTLKHNIIYKKHGKLGQLNLLHWV